MFAGQHHQHNWAFFPHNFGCLNIRKGAHDAHAAGFLGAARAENVLQTPVTCSKYVFLAVFVAVESLLKPNPVNSACCMVPKAFRTPCNRCAPL